MKSLLKKIIPTSLIQVYHKTLAVLAAFYYGNPSEKMIVVGVTGTNGKSTTVNLIAKALEAGGDKVGSTSTVSFKVAEKEWLNDKKMTMLGRFQLQKLLKQMVDAGCKYAVVETSSQGIVQSRHIGINYDYAVFTNLTPEHIEAHGGFENYKKAKGELFSWLTKRGKKKFKDQSSKFKKVKKVIVANVDDKYSEYFLGFKADKKVTYSIEKDSDYKALSVDSNADHTFFGVHDTSIKLNLIGKFNVYNTLPAIAIAEMEGMDLVKVKEKLESIKMIPGRVESIDEGQNFKVIVDYAPEPASLGKLYETVEGFEKNKVIHVLGSCGGGRDVARRPVLGKMAGEMADYVIVTNEDPYDDDPMEIINAVTQGAVDAGKTLDTDLFKIEDREKAIEKAMSLAKEGDLVLITGKGCEQAMAVKGGYVKWDDRDVARKELGKLKRSK